MKRILWLALTAGFLGCGDITTYNCCYNNVYYACPNQAALDKCGNGDTSQCTRNASKDNTCTP
jgi:hypothetical protein